MHFNKECQITVNKTMNCGLLHGILALMYCCSQCWTSVVQVLILIASQAFQTVSHWRRYLRLLMPLLASAVWMVGTTKSSTFETFHLKADHCIIYSQRNFWTSLTIPYTSCFKVSKLAQNMDFEGWYCCLNRMGEWRLKINTSHRSSR